MGVVYAARHEVLGQRVALKVLRPDYAAHEEVNARFLQEARTATRIESEHVARTLDVGKLASGLPYIVIELLEGKDLADVLTEGGPLAISDAVDHVLQALEAVAEAHAMGIVHRDLKPSNLFLARRKDGSVTVKVLDFGITKTSFDDEAVRLTSTSQILGTPAYMSPEQLRQSREVDARADVWAVGVVLYELLTGELPFLGAGVGALFAAILEDTPRTLRSHRPGVPPELEAAVMKCLVRSRASRWQSVAELAMALGPFGSRASAVSSERILRVLPLDVPVEEDPSPNTSRLPASDPWLAGPQSAPAIVEKVPPRNVDPTMRMEAHSTGAGRSLDVGPTVAPMVSTGASWADASQSSPRIRRRVPVVALVACVVLGSVGLGLVVASVATRRAKIEGLPAGAATAPPSALVSVPASAPPTVAPTGVATAATPPTSATSSPATSATTATSPASSAIVAVAMGSSVAVDPHAPTSRRPPLAHPSASAATPAVPASAASSPRPNTGILDRN